MFSIKNVKTQIIAVALMAIVALSSAPMGSALADGPNLAPNPSFENGWAFSQNCGIPCTEISDDLSFGWRKQSNGTDVAFGVSYPELALDKRVAVLLMASEGNNPRRPPGYETIQRIPIDSGKKYIFSAHYYAPQVHPLPFWQGMPWMDIKLFDSQGKYVGTVATGDSSLEAPNEWHKKIYIFKPYALKKYYPDIASVKLGLRLSLNYGMVGYEAGTLTSIAFDDVHFKQTD